MNLTPHAQILVEAFTCHLQPAVSAATLRQKKYHMRFFALFAQERNKELTDMTAVDVDAYAATKRHCIASTRRDYLATIREFYEFLRGSTPRRYLAENPVQRIPLQRCPRRRRLTLVPGSDAVGSILARLAARDDILSRRNRAMAELAYGSGLRLCELVGLDVEDIDFEKKQAYIRGKGGRTRMSPVTAVALSALRAYLDHRGGVGGGPLFVSRAGRRLAPVSVGWLFRTKVGIRSHLLRHACATHMLQNGCDVRVIQEILGHKYLTTTQVYTHIIPVDVARMIQGLHPRAATA